MAISAAAVKFAGINFSSGSSNPKTNTPKKGNPHSEYRDSEQHTVAASRFRLSSLPQPPVLTETQTAILAPPLDIPRIDWGVGEHRGLECRGVAGAIAKDTIVHLDR